MGKMMLGLGFGYHSTNPKNPMNPMNEKPNKPIKPDKPIRPNKLDKRNELNKRYSTRYPLRSKTLLKARRALSSPWTSLTACGFSGMAAIQSRSPF